MGCDKDQDLDLGLGLMIRIYGSIIYYVISTVSYTILIWVYDLDLHTNRFDKCPH